MPGESAGESDEDALDGLDPGDEPGEDGGAGQELLPPFGEVEFLHGGV